MPRLYDYKLALQHPATQLALQRLVDRELAHRAVIVAALRDAVTMITCEETRSRMGAALRAVEDSAGDEGELRKVAARLRAVIARRKRAVVD